MRFFANIFCLFDKPAGAVFPIVVVWTSRRIKTGLANMTKKHLDTTLVQAGRSKKYTQGSVNSVIQRASSLVFDTVEEKKSPRATAQKAGCFMAVAAR
jgi:cystathionine beta-lyase